MVNKFNNIKRILGKVRADYLHSCLSNQQVILGSQLFSLPILFKVVIIIE